MKYITFFFSLLFVASLQAQDYDHRRQPQTNVPTDSIRLSDPFVFADTKTKTYYMTGTGGMLWKSKDLAMWEGPFLPFEINPDSWMGPRPMVWAAEIHEYNDKYYFFATFTNQEVKIDTVAGNIIPRRACHVLVADKPEGPYKPMADPTYLPADMPTLDATLWIDSDNKPYMLFCHEWLQNRDGTVEKIQLKDDLSGTIGKSKILFRASESPWSRETTDDNSFKPNMVTDGPFVFKTSNGRIGMIWTSWVGDVYTQGVAYSMTNSLDGPWIQEPEPITPPNFGHGMIFHDFEGRTLMCLHSHKKYSQNHVDRRPHFFTVSLRGNRLNVMQEFKPVAAVE